MVVADGTEINNVYNEFGDIISNQIKKGDFIGNWLGFRGSIDLYYDINMYNSITTNFQTFCFPDAALSALKI